MMVGGNMSCMENDKILSRLNRVEGQIRGVRDMIITDRKCDDIIIQLSAISAALRATAKEILNNHISNCVVKAIKKGDEKDVIDELLVAIDKFSKLK